MTIADCAPSLKPPAAAALLLVARELAPELTAGWNVAAVLAHTGASRSQAYAMKPRVVEACAALDRRAGRPPMPKDNAALLSCACRVRDYLFEHPGAVTGRGERRRYSDGFRRLVVGLTAPGAVGEELTVEQLAEATGVPLGTLKDWRRMPARGEQEPTAPERSQASPPAEDDIAGSPQIATLLHAFENWDGDLSSFCRHAKEHLRLPWSPTFISRLLQSAGLHEPRRRNATRTTHDRDTFRRLFPGAQWLGDGTVLAIELNGQRYFFNVEAILDVHTNALVGLHVSDTEDEQAVRQAFLHAEATTGQRPIALSLDGKPCNNTDGLAQAVQPSQIVPSTPGRGQAKAPLEGAFGLFQQTAPPLVIRGDNGRELARSIITLVLLLWAWTRNGKPRARLGGRSPVDVYQDDEPTTEQVQEACGWTDELKRRHRRFCETQRRRADPTRRTLLREALHRLGIDDPDDRLAVDLARYATDAIISAIAVLDTMKEHGKLADIDHPDRYLAAVIRRKNDELELEHTAQHLLELRLRHRDLCLDPLRRDVEQLRDALPAVERPRKLLERALTARRLIDSRFFTSATIQALEQLDEPNARSLFPVLVRLVKASHDVDRARRARILAQLAQAVTQHAA